MSAWLDGTGSGMRAHLVALFAGAALSLAFAPFNLWPLAIIAPAVLFSLWGGGLSTRSTPPGRAASVGFAFGCGTFAAGTYWLYVSIHGFGKAPVWLALALMLGLVALMACYSALLGYAAARFFPQHGPVRWLIGLPAGWVLLEWIRGWFLSGFGWLSLGYSQTGTWLAGWAPLGGVYTLSLLLALMAGALAFWWAERSSNKSGSKKTLHFWQVLIVLALPWLIGLGLGRIEWTRASGAPVGVAIIQGAIPQDQKWLTENRDNSLRRYRDLTLSALGTPLIVWPEAAAPELANNIVPYLTDLARAAEGAGSSLLLGLIRAEPAESGDRPRYFNSILAFEKEITWYDKHHLVPFGEFFPVPEAVRRWMRLMNLPYSDFSRGAATQLPLQVGGLALSASICYEDAYASSQLASARASTALVNVTNDAWFGRSTARHQHLQISQMRAIEAQRYLVRAANDGISAVIGPRGEFVARAPDFQQAVLRSAIVPRTGSSPYLRFGNIPLLVLLVIALVVAVLRRSRS
ncbi:MAG: apolipoprotein N-acyltransferase [Gammaproteobacteria bacterium]